MFDRKTVNISDWLFPFYAQGARCGHIEGRDRCGVYVAGEEHEISFEAAQAQGYPRAAAESWAEGYRYGYRLAASGEGLPSVIEHAKLPTAQHAYVR